MYCVFITLKILKKVLNIEFVISAIIFSYKLKLYFLMEAVILTSWDHIMGPQIEKLWFINEDSFSRILPIPDKLLKDFNVTRSCKHDNIKDINISLMKLYTVISGQLLLGEVDACRTVDEWSSRLYISEDKILLAVLFHLNVWKCFNSNREIKNVCLCFGIVFKSDIYDLILYNHILIDHSVRKTVHAFKNSKFADNLCFKDVTSLVENVSEIIESIKNFSLRNNMSLPSLRTCTNFNFITKAFVSHLQTSGHTAVVGSSNFIINKIVNLLSIFSSKRKSDTSSASLFSNFYITGLCIQHQKTIDQSSKFLMEKAMKELCPLTVVDADSMKVWQTIPFRENSKPDKSLYEVTEKGYIVPELINDLIFIENSKGDYRSLVEDFKEELTIKSCALIKAMGSLKLSNKFLTRSDMMNLYSIKNAVDLEILLGQAETIKPGIRVILKMYEHDQTVCK